VFTALWSGLLMNVRGSALPDDPDNDGGPGPASHLYRIVDDGAGEEWFMGAWHPAPKAKSDIRWGGWLSATDDVEKAKADVKSRED
jgi:hypothetical protein